MPARRSVSSIRSERRLPGVSKGSHRCSGTCRCGVLSGPGSTLVVPLRRSLLSAGEDAISARLLTGPGKFLDFVGRSAKAGTCAPDVPVVRQPAAVGTGPFEHTVMQEPTTRTTVPVDRRRPNSCPDSTSPWTLTPREKSTGACREEEAGAGLEYSFKAASKCRRLQPYPVCPHSTRLAIATLNTGRRSRIPEDVQVPPS